MPVNVLVILFFRLRQDHTDPVGTDEPSTDWLPPDGERETAVSAAGHSGHKVQKKTKQKRTETQGVSMKAVSSLESRASVLAS